MAFGGFALKSLSFLLRFIEFCCAAIIFSIFTYYLATLHDHHLYIATYIRAVEGISGAAIVYTFLALVLVFCLGGIAIFGALGMLLDLAFAGAFIYVAWTSRGGAGSCRGSVNTPFGSGNVNTDNRVAQGTDGFARLPSLHTACKLETGAFAVAVVGIVFFILSIPIEFALIRHRKKERAFGPSPNNGYTAGSPKRKFWQRKLKNNFVEKNPDTLPPHSTPADVRTSYAPTESTAVGNDVPFNKYGNTAAYGNNPTFHGANGEYQSTATTHMPLETGYVRSHPPSNQNATGTF